MLVPFDEVKMLPAPGRQLTVKKRHPPKNPRTGFILTELL
jgi:hypothetical protein